MNSEIKSVKKEWGTAGNPTMVYEKEAGFEELKRIDELFQEADEYIAKHGENGIDYCSYMGNANEIIEEDDTLYIFIASLKEHFRNKLDEQFKKNMMNATHLLSQIKIEDIRTHEVGSLSHQYYDNGTLHSDTNSDTFSLSFKDFLGIYGNGAENESDYSGGKITLNDTAVRNFANIFKEQYNDSGTDVDLEVYLNELLKSGEFVHKRSQPAAEFFAGLIDMVPVIGGVKNLADLGYGYDIITADEFTEDEKKGKTIRLLVDVVAAEFTLGSIRAELNGTNQITTVLNDEGIGIGDKAGIESFRNADDISNRVLYSEGGKYSYKEIKSFTADETNQWFIDNVKKDYKPPYKPGTVVKEIELSNNTTFVRVYDNMPDGSGMYGSWVMRAEDIDGLTPLEIQNKFALPNTPKYVCDVQLEVGTHIRVGEVNPLDGWGNGGGTQYDLIGQRIGKFENERLLEVN